ncbi:MAG: dicarboxylate/amino acid:cation symporter [Ichthyobacteriaceae bacterium]|nr:dicarboxylate/amino acid:cation symporter [Ichthyobacteriaceae bacterium]
MGKKKIALHWQIIIGLLLGVVWALFSSHFGLTEFTLNWIEPFGQVFINLLKLIAVPLVLFSIIGGVTGIGDPDKLGKMGAKTIVLYLSTTVLAITLGLILVNVIQPGKKMDKSSILENRINYELWAQTNGLTPVDGECVSCKAENSAILNSVVEKSGMQIVTNDVQDKIKLAKSTKDARPLQFLVDMVPSNIFVSLNNNGLMLQVIVFALLFGISLLLISKHSSYPIIQLVNGMTDVFVKMVELTMAGAPFFVFSLMAGIVSKMAGDDPTKVLDIFMGLSWYAAVVAIGLLSMIYIIYPLVLFLFIGKEFNYKKFFQGISEAQTLAFSTSSSVATLPITMECVEENLGVDKRVTSFVLPIGATINMDGTSLYQAVAVIFLAHMHGIDLDLSQQVTIVLTTTLASIGTAAIPGAGLVMLMIVLQTVGLNPAWIAIIIPVDRILDMIRTVVNVTGDATVSTIIDKTEKNKVD